MSKICLEAEKQVDYRKLYTDLRKHVIHKQGGVVSVPESIASSAVKTSWDLKASLIIVLSDSGSTVRFVSKYRPHAPILCITSTSQTARQLRTSRGVIPHLVPDMKNSSKLIEEGIAWAKEQVREARFYVKNEIGLIISFLGYCQVRRSCCYYLWFN